MFAAVSQRKWPGLRLASRTSFEFGVVSPGQTCRPGLCEPLFELRDAVLDGSYERTVDGDPATGSSGGGLRAGWCGARLCGTQTSASSDRLVEVGQAGWVRDSALCSR